MLCVRRHPLYIADVRIFSPGYRSRFWARFFFFATLAPPFWVSHYSPDYQLSTRHSRQLPVAPLTSRPIRYRASRISTLRTKDDILDHTSSERQRARIPESRRVTRSTGESWPKAYFQRAAAAAACSLSHLGEHSISMASILAARTRSGKESLLEFGLGYA